jgi:hypothetical protein
MLTPTNGNYMIEPRLHSDIKTQELRKRMAKSGLLTPDIKPDSKTTFEGIPNTGTIRFVPADADPNLKVGMVVVFDEPKPHGFKWEGMTLFPIKREQIIAGLIEDDDAGTD